MSVHEQLRRSVVVFCFLQESLPVVYHRFSDGVDVLKCVSGFIKVSWRAS